MKRNGKNIFSAVIVLKQIASCIADDYTLYLFIYFIRLKSHSLPVLQEVTMNDGIKIKLEQEGYIFPIPILPQIIHKSNKYKFNSISSLSPDNLFSPSLCHGSSTISPQLPSPKED